MHELSIIVPCVSTTAPLPAFLDALAEYIMENPSDMEVIVVANERAENPERLAAYASERYPWLRMTLLQRNGSARNFGALARFGLAYSASRYAAFVSPYGEDDLSILPTMLKKMRSGNDVVQATRYATPNDERLVPLHFRLYQQIYRAFIRLLLGYAIRDSTYGYKMFDRIFIQALGLSQNGYSVSPEITLKALLAGGRVASIPSAPRTAPENRDFKLRREGIGYFWLVLRGAFHRIGFLWF